jgi:N-acetylneuraminic acid mutarotase
VKPLDINNYFQIIFANFLHTLCIASHYIPRGGKITMQLSKRKAVLVGIHGLFRFMIIIGLLSAGFTVPLPAPVQARPAVPQGAWASTIDHLITARTNHTATLLQNGKVLVTGGNQGTTVLQTSELFDPAFGSWKSAGLLGEARKYHTATLLLNGMVLVVGGHDGANPLASADLYDPTTGQWSSAAPLSVARFHHTATLLSDGRVLVAGGQGAGGGVLNSAQIYNPADNTWSTTVPNMAAGRAWHTANLLSDGKVLVIGGLNGSGGALDAYQVYDPADNSWSSPFNLNTARYGHTATVLFNDDVLVAGGANSSVAFNTAEVLHPDAGTWTDTALVGVMSSARFNATATLLPDGNVLLAGGQSELGGSYIDTSEVYQVDKNPGDADIFAPIGSLSTPRAGHSATLLANGQVLVVGGNNIDVVSTCDLFSSLNGSWDGGGITGTLVPARYSPVASPLLDGRILVVGGQSGVPYNNADIYDSAQAKWLPAQHMIKERMVASATLLTNGKVLVAGGQGKNSTPENPGDFLNTAELYDPASNTWSETGAMHDARANHTATLLPSGQVMVVGGQNKDLALDSVEYYNPSSGTWTVGRHLNIARFAHTATLLQNGKVLVVGGAGKDDFSGALKSTEIYDPNGGSWWTTSGMLDDSREYHTATLLANGSVLIVGGYNKDGTDMYGCQLYNPASNSWTHTGDLTTARSFHTATLLQSGKVLVAGGRLTNQAKPLDPPITLTSTELYDPATGLWANGGDLNVGRYYHVAALLPNGKVIIAGGGQYDQNGLIPLSSSELYDPGNYYDLDWQPVINGLPDKLRLSDRLTLTGSQLRGYNFSEGSGGGQNSSASNYPLVQLRRLDNNEVHWLMPDPKAGFSETSFTSQPVSKIAAGLATVTVFVNGIQSISKVILIENNFMYLAVALKPQPPITHTYLPCIQR